MHAEAGPPGSAPGRYSKHLRTAIFSKLALVGVTGLESLGVDCVDDGLTPLVPTPGAGSMYHALQVMYVGRQGFARNVSASETHP